MPKSFGNGDANDDGYIDEKDVNAIVEYIMGNISENPYDFNEYSADLNGDGKVDVADIVELNILLKEQ
jgi:Ca2+-binding EF-hand superfamily protein